MISKNGIFSNDKFIGYVSKITLDSCYVQIPSSALISPFWDNGTEYVAGIVGTYVLIEGLNKGFLGKIREVSIPEDDIKKLNESDPEDKKKNYYKKFHPYAIVDLLLCFDYCEMQIKKGISTFPLVSSKVYLCDEKFLERIISNKAEEVGDFSFATLQNLDQVNVNIKQSAIFGRHCAIIGNTGGGKSWTVARIVEEMMGSRGNKKVILIDATGEYDRFSKLLTTTSIYFGDKDKCPTGYIHTNYHYSQLAISDLQIMLRPSPQSQTPILLESIKSLKIVRNVLKDEGYKFKNQEGTPVRDSRAFYNVSTGVLRKASAQKQQFLIAMRDLKSEINSDNNDYDITCLVDQIKEECIYESDFNDSNKFGGVNNKDYGNQTTLISRIISMLNNKTLDDVFEFKPHDNSDGSTNSFRNVFNDFINADDKKLLLINLSRLGFDYNVREILVNIIGKELLKRARDKEFEEEPVIVFIDEAHQFLNKKLQDSFSGDVELNAFDLIAKECRKYGLYVCIATQMPRDIPIGTLSQIGTFIIHRLINDQDIDKIKGSCSETNRWILSGLANLSSGEAIISSVNLPFPLTVKIKVPTIKPKSESPIEILDKV